MDIQIIRKHPIVTGALIVAALSLVLVVLFLENILVLLGSNLLEKEEPRRASYIVVLQGGIPDRIVHGADLYNEGYADTVLMVESHSFNNYELIDEHGLDLPSAVDINKEAALQLGVNKEDIVILPGRVDSTSQEAEAVAAYLSGDFGESKKESKIILLVTSKFHSNRAKLIFENKLEAVEVISTPSPYDPFCPKKWWQDRRQVRNLFMEYLKLMNFYTLDI